MKIELSKLLLVDAEYTVLWQARKLKKKNSKIGRDND